MPQTPNVQIRALAIEEYRQLSRAYDLPLYLLPEWLEVCTEGDGVYWVCLRGERPLALYVALYRAGQILLPPFCQYGGFYLLDQELSPLEEQRLLTALIDQLPAHSYFYLQHSPRLMDWLAYYWRGFRQTTRYNYILPLSGITSEEDYLQRIGNHLRRDYRQARARGLRYEPNMPLGELLPLLRGHSQRLGYRLDIPMLERLVRVMQEQGKVDLVGLRNPEGEAVVGAILIRHGERAILLSEGATASLPQGVQYKPLLIGQYVLSRSPQIQLLDFEGSMLPGVNQLLLRLGAIPEPYFAISRGRRSVWGRLVRRLSQKLCR